MPGSIDKKRRLRWYLIIGLCLVFLGMIIHAWNKRVTYYNPRSGQLVDRPDVESAIEDEASKPIVIPTGIFIQSIHFESPYDVTFTGHIWQKYDDNIPETVSRGFLFPEQVQSDTTVIEEIYRRKGNGHEVIGWSFDVTVRHPFDYRKYPLDRHDVRLQIWHKDFFRNVMLVPDLEAYDSTTPGETFGVDEAIMAGGWQIEETWFGYTKKSYDTNFGIDLFQGQRNTVELQFHVVMTRRFNHALLVNLMPMLVVATILFGLLLGMSTDEEQSDRFGFDMLASLGASTALLFTIIIAHTEWRQQFPGARLAYMECIYLIMYVVLVLVGINAYLMTYSTPRRGVVQYNYICQLAFWPILLGSLAAITLYYF